MLAIAANSLTDYWTVNIYPDKPYAPNSVAVGLGAAPWDGLARAMTGTTRQIRVQAFDVYGNQKTTGGDGTFSYSIVGGYPTTLSVGGFLQDVGDGTHILTYNLSRSGAYLINITVFAAQLSGSPFSTELVPQAPSSLLSIPRSTPKFGGTTVNINATYFDVVDFVNYLEYVGNNTVQVRLMGFLDDGLDGGLELGWTDVTLSGLFNVSTKLVTFQTPSFPFKGTLSMSMKGYGQDWSNSNWQFQVYREPSVSTLSPIAGPVSGDTEVIITGDKFVETSEARCSFGTGLFTDALILSYTQIRCISPVSANPNTHDLQVKVALNGQQFTISSSAYKFYAAPVVLYGSSPASGPTTGNSLLTFRGVNFVETTIITCSFTFPNVTVNAVINSDGNVTCFSPSSIGHVNNVTLDNIGPSTVRVALNGQQYTQTSVTFEYHKVPYVTAISPDHGSFMGGTLVTVNGTNFVETGEIVCRFGVGLYDLSGQIGDYDTSAFVVNTLGEPQIRCMTPTNFPQADTVSVEISLNGQQFTSNNFIFHFVAQIDSIAPVRGPASGGTVITLTGAGFTDTGNLLKCKFGTQWLVPAIFNSTDQVTCISPTILESVVDVLLELSMDNGTYLTTNQRQFSFYITPSVTALGMVYPSLPVLGNDMLTIHGTNFAYTPDLQVKFGFPDVVVVGSIASSPAGTASSPITCYTPDLTSDNRFPTDVTVEITMNGQQFTSNNVQINFYDPRIPPSIAQIVPASGRQQGNTKVNIYGSNFANLATLECSFAGQRYDNLLQATFVSSTHMFCYSPPNYGPDGVTYVTGSVQVSATNGQQVDSFTGQNIGPIRWSVESVNFRYTMTSPAHSTHSADSLGSSLVAGYVGSFSIQAVRSDGQPRITGGDTFYAVFTQQCSLLPSAMCYKDVLDNDVPYVYSSVVIDLDADVQDQLLLDEGYNYLDHIESVTNTTDNATQVAAKDLVDSGINAGQYFVVLNVTVSGSYELSIRTANMDIIGSPLQMNVSYDVISQDNCGVTGSGAESAIAGEIATLYIQARDRWGNNRTNEVTPFSAELVWCGNQSRISCNDTLTGDGPSLDVVFLSAQYGMSAFTYSTTSAGMYQLRITSNDESIAGTPRPLPIYPAATYPPNCVFTHYPTADTISNTIFAGNMGTFGISTFDQYMNPREFGGDSLNITLIGNQTVTASVVDYGDSTYDASFNVTISGAYMANVQIMDFDIDNSPRFLLVRPAEILPSKCESYGYGIVGAAVGATNVFYIQARDRFGNKRDEPDGIFVSQFTVDQDLDPWRGILPPLNFTSTYISAGLYLMGYNISEAGNYIMTTKFYGLPIISGWLRIFVEPAPVDPSTCVSTGAGIGNTIAGSDTFFLLQLRDKFHNNQIESGMSENITIMLERLAPLPLFWTERPDLEPETITIEDLGQGLYNISYLAFPAMFYDLHVQFNGVEVQLSPFRVQKNLAPPPQLVSSKFDDSLIRITLQFDTATNQAAMTAGSLCSEVLPTYLVSILGTGPVCIWKSATELSVSLGYKSTITTTAAAKIDLWDLYMEIKPATLIGYYENTHAVNNTVDILAPDNPPTPVAIIEAPILVGLCEPMIINADKSYGGGPRPLRFTWSEGFNPYQIVNSRGGLMLESYLQTVNADNFNKFRNADSGTMSIYLDKNDTAPGQMYNWTVTVQSFINNVGTIHWVAQKEPVPLPIVFVRGATDITAYSSDEIIIQGDAALPDPECVPPEWKKIDFQWIVSDPSVYVKPASLASRTLFLPSGTFQAYSVYTLNLTAWLSLNPDALNYAVITVQVRPDELLAGIVGGDRIVGSQQNITLDGSISIDPDNIVGSNISYRWSCWMEYLPQTRAVLGIETGPCVNASNEVIMFPQDFTNLSVLTIPSNTLLGVAHPGHPYVFTLNISKESNVSGWHDIRYASTSATIAIVYGAPPTISVDPLLQKKVNPSKRVVLTATTTSTVPETLQPLRWYIIQGTLNLDDRSVSTTGREGNNLVINPNRLIPGQTYKFRLQAIDANGASYGQLTVPINAAPASGIFEVSPTNGTALNTTFTLKNTGWADDPDDMPLRYRFSVIKGAEPEKPLADLTPNEALNVLLPEGPWSNKSLMLNATNNDSTAIQNSSWVGQIEQLLLASGSSSASWSDVDSSMSNSWGDATDLFSRRLQTTNSSLVATSGSGSWSFSADDFVPEDIWSSVSGSSSWSQTDDAFGADNMTQSNESNIAVDSGPYYTPWDMYELTIVSYVTDKYKAETRREFNVVVSPPSIIAEGSDEDGAAALASSMLDSVVDDAANVGDLQAAGQATASIIDMLNSAKNVSTHPTHEELSGGTEGAQNYRRRLAEYQESPQGQNRSALRERMMSIAASVATGSPDTDVGRTSTFQMAGALSDNPGEMNPSVTTKGIDLMKSTLSGGNAVDPSSAGDATGALSNLLLAADFSSALPAADTEDYPNATAFDNETRRAAIGLDNHTLSPISTSSPDHFSLGNSSDNNTNHSSVLGNMTCEELPGLECGDCEQECGVLQPSGDFESRGHCLMHACVCNPYPCIAARCLQHFYPEDPDGCYTAMDGCTNGTCVNVTCEVGSCGSDEPQCVPGRCVPTEDGGIECFDGLRIGLGPTDGACPFHEQHYQTPWCESTQEATAHAQLVKTKEAKCSSALILQSVDSVSGGLVKERVLGEDDIDVQTGNIKMKSARKSPTELANSSLNTPGTDTALGIPGAAVEGAAGAVDMTAKSWAVNPFGFSESSSALASDVVSLSLTTSNSTVSWETPYVLEMPVPFINMTANESCPNECSSPRKSRRPPQGRCVDDVCVCYQGFTGADCSVKVECKYWDYTSDAWSTEGCQVAMALPDRTICHCTHLSDFGGTAESALPDLNTVDPFDLDGLGSFAEDPRNIMSLALVLGLYFTFGYLMYSGHKKDLADRHRAYLERVLESITPSEKEELEVPAPQGDDEPDEKMDGVPDDMLRVKDKAQIGVVTVVRNRLHACNEWRKAVTARAMGTLADAHPWVSCVYVRPEDPFTRPQRMIVLLSVIMGNIVICALFFEVPPCGPKDEGYPDCPTEPDPDEPPPPCLIPGMDDGDPETVDCMLDVPTLLTSIIIGLIMLPCDRCFIGMFAKIRPQALSAAAVGASGKPWSLPRVTPTEDELVRKVQARFRGNLQRKKLRTMNAVMESYAAEDLSKTQSQLRPETVVLQGKSTKSSKSFAMAKLKHLRRLQSMQNESPQAKSTEPVRSTPERRVSPPGVFDGPAAVPPGIKTEETRGAESSLKNLGYTRKRAFPTSDQVSIRPSLAPTAWKQSSLALQSTRQHRRRMPTPPTHAPSPGNRPPRSRPLPMPAMQVTSLGSSADQYGELQLIPAGSGNHMSRQSRPLPTLPTHAVLPKAPPKAAPGTVVRSRMFALPGSAQSAESALTGLGRPETPNSIGNVGTKSASVLTQEMPADKIIRLVVWVQASFRGMKARAEVRRLIAVKMAKIEQDDTAPEYVKPASGMKLAKAKAKAKQKAKQAAKAELAAKEEAKEQQRLERQLQKKIRRKFDALDTDGSGSLDEDELKALLEDVGLKLSRGQLRRAMAKMDGDGSGSVEFEEFAQWYREFHDPEKQKGFFSSFFATDPDEVAKAEYEAKVARATQQVKEHAKRKRKGKLGQPDDGLWPHGMVWVAYFLTGFFCLCCGWYTVLLALSFGPETTAKWLGGFISTLIYQSVIQDPCKIGLVILFMDSAEFWLELYYEFMEYLPFDISFMMEE